LGILLCLAHIPLRDYENGLNRLSHDFYCRFEELFYLSRLADIDTDQMRSLEFELDRLCYVLELYEYDFPTGSKEQWPPEQACTIRLYLEHVLERLDDVRLSGELKPEDEQYFAGVWDTIDEMLGTPGLYEWLYNKIIEENLLN